MTAYTHSNQFPPCCHGQGLTPPGFHIQAAILTRRILKICELETTLTTCFEWPFLRTRGYGVTQADGKFWRAHRLSYTMAKGPIPDGMQIMHTCHNPACVNPDHLKPGTARENALMSIRDGRPFGRRGYPQSLRKRCVTLRNGGLLLKEVSARTGTSVATISRWCRGHTPRRHNVRGAA